MRSPAAAFAWEFRARHRWGITGVVAYVMLLAVFKLVVISRGVPFYLDSPESFAFVMMVPLTAAVMYFLAVFTFGLDGDLAARQSMYPLRRLALPVTTNALTAWPMIYGSAVMIALWTALRAFGIWPATIELPWVWPALFGTSLLAWAQALTWMPYPLPGLRIMMMVLWLAITDTTALLALHFNTGEWRMIGILAPQIPAAYLVARFAVARARQGVTPDWRHAPDSLSQAQRFTSARNFKSPAAAQAWFEWRRHGWSVPTWVAILLPFELLLLWGAGESASLVFTILLGVLLTPPFIATFAAAAVSTSTSGAGDNGATTAFVATRPLTNAELVAAKLKMAVRSTLLAWLIVLVCIPIAVLLSGKTDLVIHAWHRDAEFLGMPRAVVLSLLILIGCIAATWAQLIQSLYIGLTGRASLVKASVFLAIGFVVLLGPFTEWITDSGRLGALWSALPFIFSALVAAKMTVVVWIGLQLYRKRLVSDRTLVIGAGAWSVTVFCLYAVLAWLVDAPHIPQYLIMLVAILSIPIARLSAAPIALAWNRHR